MRARCGPTLLVDPHRTFRGVALRDRRHLAGVLLRLACGALGRFVSGILVGLEDAGRGSGPVRGGAGAGGCQRARRGRTERRGADDHSYEHRARDHRGEDGFAHFVHRCALLSSVVCSLVATLASEPGWWINAPYASVKKARRVEDPVLSTEARASRTTRPVFVSPEGRCASSLAASPRTPTGSWSGWGILATSTPARATTSVTRWRTAWRSACGPSSPRRPRMRASRRARSTANAWPSPGPASS